MRGEREREREREREGNGQVMHVPSLPTAQSHSQSQPCHKGILACHDSKRHHVSRWWVVAVRGIRVGEWNVVGANPAHEPTVA